MDKDEYDWDDSEMTTYASAFKRAFNQWEADNADWNKCNEIASKIKPKPKADYEGMLRRLMTDLRSTGSDTFAVLKDEELGEWWSEEVKKIEREEAKAAAKERALSTLSPAERKLLGLGF